MSKNLTRKGLALGAIIALGSTVIAGTPALAIDPVSLAPTTGSGYTTILGQTFSLTSQFTDAAQVANESLKWVITDSSDKLDVTSGINGGAATRNATTHKIVVSGTNSYGAQNLTLAAASSNTTDAFDVSVQAWMDFNNDNVVDSGEATSTAQTVKFVTLANSGAAVKLGALVIGDATATATLSFGADVNVAQIANGAFEIAFGKLVSGSPQAAVSGHVFTAGSANGSALTYDSTDKVLKTTAAASLLANATADIYVAQALTSAGVLVGSPVYLTVAAAVATGITAVASTTGDNISGSGAAYSVRTGTKTVAVSSAVTKTVDAVAGVKAAGIVGVVTASYAAASGDTATTITVGGKTLNSTTTSATFEATSNADGKFVFDVVSSTGKVGSAVTLSVKVPGLNATTNTVYTWADATIATTGLKVVATGADYRAVVKGGTVSVDYVLVDNFGAVVTDAGYRVAVSVAGVGVDGATVTKFVDIVAGKANVSFVAATASTSASIVAKVQKADATTGNSADLSPLPTVTSNLRVLTAAQAASAVTATASATTGVALETETFVAGNDLLQGNSFTPAYTNANAVTITGDVTDALGAAVYGASVTVSAPGLFFKSGDVYAIGSITVQSNDAGRYEVQVFGNKSGKVTFTVTSGAATKTVDVTFASGLRANIVAAGTTVVVPSASQAGRSVDLTATIVDKFGNPVSGVDVTFAVTGVGTLSDADGVVATNDKGVATVKLTAQYAEFGDATVTVTHAGADATSTVTSDDFSVVKNVAFGVTDASIDLLGKRVIVTAEFAKGKKVTVYDNGVRKYSAIQTSDAERIIAWNVKKGSHNIVMKISGGYSDNLVLTIK